MKYFRKSTELERRSLAHYFSRFSLWLLKPNAFGEAEYHMRKAGRKKWTPYALAWPRSKERQEGFRSQVPMKKMTSLYERSVPKGFTPSQEGSCLGIKLQHMGIFKIQP